MPTFVKPKGGLAQLARVLAWQARGHRFESDILHLLKASWSSDYEAFFEIKCPFIFEYNFC